MSPPATATRVCPHEPANFDHDDGCPVRSGRGGVGTPAAAYTEVADAPDLPPGQTVSGPLTSIGGTFGSLSDVDLYRIDITDAASFSAATSAAADTDTVLFLFDTSGFAIGGNDDVTGGPPSDQYFSLLTGVAGLTNGTYLLAISRWPYFPVSAGGQMYPIDLQSEAIVPDQGVTYPSGPGGAQALSGWQNAFNTEDPLQPVYSIALTGVPEPSAGAGCAVAITGFAAIRRARSPSS